MRSHLIASSWTVYAAIDGQPRALLLLLLAPAIPVRVVPLLFLSAPPLRLACHTRASWALLIPSAASTPNRNV